jgi:hypothetical protein
MSELGFIRGVAVPCLFYHPVREIRVAIHGDDFTSLGEAVNPDWLQIELKKHFELNVRGRIGPSPKDDKCIRLLSRIIPVDNRRNNLGSRPETCRNSCATLRTR